MENTFRNSSIFKDNKLSLINFEEQIIHYTTRELRKIVVGRWKCKMEGESVTISWEINNEKS